MLQSSNTSSLANSDDLTENALTGNPEFSQIQTMQMTRSGPVDYSEFSMTRVEEAFDSLYNLLGSLDNDEKSIDELLAE